MTGDRHTEAEGKTDQVKGHAKDAAQDVKDAAHGVAARLNQMYATRCAPPSPAPPRGGPVFMSGLQRRSVRRRGRRPPSPRCRHRVRTS
jgi:hypothetical protein